MSLEGALWGIPKGEILVITFANVNYMDFMENWVAHARHAQIPNIIVGAMDDQARAPRCRLAASWLLAGC